MSGARWSISSFCECKFHYAAQPARIPVVFWRSSFEGVRCGPLAQLVERHVYTVDVIGSSPVGPTT